MATFLTRARVKRAAGVPTGITFHDALIDDLLDVAEEAVLQWLQIPGLTTASYNETHDTRYGQDRLSVRAWPITSIAALTDDGSAVSADDYYHHDTAPYVYLKDSGTFTGGSQKVQITYTAGWSPVPDRFVQAAAFQAVAMWNAGRHSGFQGESGPDYSYRIDPDGLCPMAKTLLRGDRRIVAASRFNAEDY